MKPFWAFLFFVLFSVASQSPEAASRYASHEVRAAILVSLRTYVVRPGSGALRHYCGSATGEVEETLQALIASRPAAGIRYFVPGEEGQPTFCDVVYVGDDALILDAITGDPLIIGRDQMIELVEEDSRIVMVLDLDEVRGRGFEVSSKLIRIARLRR